MSDFLGRLAARGVGLAETLGPRLPSRFEPPAAGAAPGWSPGAPDGGDGSDSRAGAEAGAARAAGPATRGDLSGPSSFAPAQPRPPSSPDVLPHGGGEAPAKALAPAAAAEPAPLPRAAAFEDPPAPATSSPRLPVPAGELAPARRHRRRAGPGAEPAAAEISPAPSAEMPRTPAGAAPPAHAPLAPPATSMPTAAARWMPPAASPPVERSAGPAAPGDQRQRAGDRTDPRATGRLQPPMILAQPARSTPLPPTAAPFPGTATRLPRGTRPERPAEGTTAPTIQVTIGRLEVRATPPPAAGSRLESAPAPRPAPTLEDYLRRRSRGADR